MENSFSNSKLLESETTRSKSEILKGSNSPSNDNGFKDSLSLSDSSCNERFQDLIIENMRLKHILQQKDCSIRKQFNMIIIWNNEMMKVCENYKKKFSETNTMLNTLKQENTKLNNNLQHHTLKNKSTVSSDYSEFEYSGESGNETECENNSPSKREIHLISQLRDLRQEFNKVKNNYSEIRSQYEEMENRYSIDLKQYAEKLIKYQEELELLKQNIKSEDSELLNLVDEKCKIDSAMKNVDVSNNTSQVSTEHKFVEYEKMHIQKLSNLFVKCFDEKCVKYFTPVESVEDSNDIIQNYKSSLINFKNNGLTNEAQAYAGETFDYCKFVIEQHLQMIRDERLAVSSQRQFLKVLSDYNNIMHQLKALERNINPPIQNYDMTATNNFDDLAMIEKCLNEEKKLLNVEKEKLSNDRLEIERQRQVICEEREVLNIERIALDEEKNHIIKNDNELIDDENEKLRRSLAVLETKVINISQENKRLEKTCKSSIEDLNKTKEKLRITEETIEQLQDQLTQMLDKEDTITAYRMQAEMREFEFAEMRDSERNFLDQIATLQSQLNDLQAIQNNPSGTQPNPSRSLNNPSRMQPNPSGSECIARYQNISPADCDEDW